MSIATQISRLNNNIDNLKTTKQSIKEAINEDFNIIADEQIENYADLVEKGFELYKDYIPPTKTEQATEITVTDAMKYSKNKLDVFGNLNQETRSGKNKFNAEKKLNASTTKNNITYTKNADNTFDIIGTASANTAINVASVIDLIQKAKSYYLYSSKEYNVTTFNLSVVIRYVDDDVQYIKANNSIVTTLKDKEIKNAGLNFYAVGGTTVNASNVKIMLVESNTIDNEFEEYGAMPSLEYPSMPITATGVQKIRICRKNLLKLNDTKTVTYQGVNITINNNKIVFNGTATGGRGQIINTGLFAIIKQYAYLKIKEISGTITGTTYRLFLTSDDTDMSTAIVSTTGTEQEIIKSTKGIIKNLGIYLNKGAVFDNYTIEIMLAESNIAVDFEEYNGEDITLDLGTTELCKIVDKNGNVVAQDKEDYKEKMSKWEKYIKKRVFDGTENWIQNADWNTNYPDIFHAYISLADWKIGQTNAILDKLKFYSYSKWTEYVNKECCAVNKTKNIIYLFIRADRLETQDTQGLKKYLANNNITMWYELAEPEYADCTPEQSAVLDKLYKLALEKGTNNIFVESENGVTLELSLTYIQNLLSKTENTEVTNTDVGNIEET